MNFKNGFAALGLAATVISGGAVAATADAATTPVTHACTKSVTRTYAGVTYNAAAYTNASINHGLPGACSLPYGSKGSLVVSAQKALNTFLSQHGVKTTLATDGVFGPLTKSAIMKAESLSGMPQTGVYANIAPILLEPFYW